MSGRQALALQAAHSGSVAIVAFGLTAWIPDFVEDAKKRTGLSADRAKFVGDDPWLTRWFDRYWTQPFIDAAYREAKGPPIEQGEG